MRHTTLITVVGLLALSTTAIPVAEEVAEHTSLLHLLPRLGNNDGSSAANARDLEMECRGQPDNCDQNAYAIMCLGAKEILQRSASSDRNRQNSGAKYQPFDKPSSVQAAIGVSVPSSRALPYNSAEEYPYASSTDGGFGSILFPTQRLQQLSQGGALSSILRNVPTGSWYRITKWKNCPRPYCQAYNAEPRDYSVCKKTNKDDNGIDWADYAFRRISDFGESYKFQLVPRPASLIKRGIDTLQSNITIEEPLPRGEQYRKQKRADFPTWVTKDSITCLSDGIMPNDGTFPLATACLADFVTAESNVNGGLPVSRAFCSFGGSTVAMCSYKAPNYGAHDEMDRFNQLADEKCGARWPAWLFISDWEKTYWRSSTGMKNVCTNNGGITINAGGPGAGSG